jgi:hypothetical protein
MIVEMSKPKRDGPGRPPFVPTEQDRRTVQTMTAGGIEQWHIAACLSAKISLKTMRKAFAAELVTARARADAAVIASLHRHATGDGNQAVAAAKWWTQARMGWRDTTQIANEPGGAFAINVITGVPREPDAGETEE